MFDIAQWEIATTAAGLADRSDRGTVVAAGTEVVPLLQGIVTSNVFSLAEEGSGQLSTATNSNGRLVCDLRFLHVPDLLIMDFEPGLVKGGVVSHFRANVMMEDAKFLDRSSATGRLCVVGPAAADAIDAAAKLVRPSRQLESWHASWGELAGHDVIVQHIPTYGVAAYDIFFAREVFDEVRESLELPRLDAPTLEALRIDAGTARWGAELDEKIIPLEAGLDDAIAYDKGCYVGQEIIARLDTLGRPAKLLRSLRFEERIDDIAAGAVIASDGKNIGEVRSATWSPRRESTVALGYVKRDHYELGNVVDVAGHPAVVGELRD